MIVLGVDSPIGLTIVRELGLHGARVVGVGSSWRGVGLHSRYLHARAVSPARDDQRLELIRRLAAEHDVRFLMAVSEPDLLWLNRHREALASIRLLIPAEGPLRLVLDKDHICRIADRVGILTPRTLQPESLTDVEHAAREFEYPVVLKWARPYDVMDILRKAGLPMLKLDYCYDPDDLLERLRPFARAGVFPLLQSYCAGVGLGHMILMHKGAPLLLFRHLRIREWPPEGGFSTICESLPMDPQDPLLRRSIHLLQTIEWEGPAMVEYRYDPHTGRAALMEINGRFWGSLPLAFHAGAHFAWGTLSALGLGRADLPNAYRAGVRCVNLIPELKRLTRVLFAPGKILDRQLHFQRRREIGLLLSLLLSPKTRYFVFSPSDPLPALADMVGMVGAAVGRLSTGVFRRGRAA